MFRGIRSVLGEYPRPSCVRTMEMDHLARGVSTEALELFSDTDPDWEVTSTTGTLPVLEASENVFHAPTRVMSENTAMTHPTTRRNDVRAFPFHPAASPSKRSPGVVPRMKVAMAMTPRSGSHDRMTASSIASVNPHGRRNVKAPMRAGAVFCTSP